MNLERASPRVAASFERWQRIVNSPDTAAIASQYSDPFMFADPTGVRTVERARFVAALPRRCEFFRSLGHTGTQIGSLNETALDDRYVMVQARFLMRFERAASQQVDAEVESTFILYFGPDAPTIVFHMEHEDLQRVLQRLGLVPNAPEQG